MATTRWAAADKPTSRCHPSVEGSQEDCCDSKNWRCNIQNSKLAQSPDLSYGRISLLWLPEPASHVETASLSTGTKISRLHFYQPPSNTLGWFQNRRCLFTSAPDWSRRWQIEKPKCFQTIGSVHLHSYKQFALSLFFSSFFGLNKVLWGQDGH